MRFILYVFCMMHLSLYSQELEEQPAQPIAPTQSQEGATAWSSTITVDTSADQGRGNWFKKREIFQQARRLYQEIVDQVQKNNEQMRSLIEQYSTSVEQMNKPDLLAPVTGSAIEQLLNNIKSSIEQLSAAGQKDQEMRTKLVELNDSKQILEQLQEELSYFSELQSGLTQALALVQVQMDQGLAFKERAWKLYELIDEALSDQIAEQYLYEMQSIIEHSKKIAQYTTQDLTNYFQTTVTTATTTQKKIQELYQQLVERSLFESKEGATPIDKKTPVKPAQSSWWSWIFKPFIWIWQGLVWLWNWLLRLFGR